MDNMTPEQRKRCMSNIQSRNTSPEKAVRTFLHKKGFRFRLHKKELPGKPDIVLPKYRTAIFINGCFWHRHPGCPKASTPKSNTAYWDQKFKRNIERDRSVQEMLKEEGWHVIVLWECRISDEEKLARDLGSLLEKQ